MLDMAKTTDRSAVTNRSARGLWLIGCAIALMGTIGSCGDTDETPPGEYSEPCDNNTVCANGLTCVIGICTQTCGTTAECRANLGSSTSTCIAGVCQEPCSPTDPCPAGLRCIQMAAGSSCLP